MRLLNVTEKSHTPLDPVIWVLVGLEVDGSDEGQVCPTGFLVHRTDIKLGILGGCCIDGIDVDYRHGHIQDL